MRDDLRGENSSERWIVAICFSVQPEARREVFDFDAIGLLWCAAPQQIFRAHARETVLFESHVERNLFRARRIALSEQLAVGEPRAARLTRKNQSLAFVRV